MSERITHGSLKVSQELDNFLKDELLPGLDINPETFWESFERVLDEFGPRNNELLAKRTEIFCNLSLSEEYISLSCRLRTRHEFHE